MLVVLSVVTVVVLGLSLVFGKKNTPTKQPTNSNSESIGVVRNFFAAVQEQNIYNVSKLYAKNVGLDSETIQKTIIEPLNAGYRLDACTYKEGTKNGADGGLVTATCPLKSGNTRVAFRFMVAVTADGSKIARAEIARAQ